MDEHELERLLRRHLADELDGQLGRSTERFREHLREEAAGFARPTNRPRPGRWMLSVAGAAMAASIAAVFAVPSLLNQSGGPGVSTDPLDPLPAIRVDHTVRSQVYDNGTFLTPDGTPVRRFRRLNLHEMRWIDERSGEQGEEIVPSEDVMYYELKTY